MDRKTGTGPQETVSKPKLLYISTNDGSDMRINKEIRTLSREFSVLFVGIGDEQKAFVKPYCLEVHLAPGKRRQIQAVLRQYLIVAQLLWRYRIQSVHLLNELLMILYYPLAMWKHTVLDIFDSIFLIRRIAPHDKLWLKRLVYWPANVIIVTDENRRGLMPSFTQNRLSVLENFPLQFSAEHLRKQPAGDRLRILFFGWLGMQRGGTIAAGLLEADERTEVLMAGWFSDSGAEALQQHERATYLGVMPQEEALKLAAQQADYILCLYAPVDLNQINASPNKIYDAIQTRTPLVINREVKVARLVEELNVGVVIDSYDEVDYTQLTTALRQRRGTFSFNDALARTYAWETIEDRLLAAHGA